MYAPYGVPSPPDTDADSSAHSDASTSDSTSYTPDELAVIFLDFYRALTKLHYDAADLRLPPPGGWPNLTPELCANFRSDLAIEVLRRLPYFDSTAYIHYKSKLIDCSSLDREYFASSLPRDAPDDLQSAEGDEVDPADVVCIAAGEESFGREMFLNVKHGEVIEEMIRSGPAGGGDIKTYFESLLEAYRSLKLIPCAGRITIEAWDVGERAGHITEEELASRPRGRMTDLDVQYIRQLYRQLGWLDAFRRSDAERAIDRLETLMGGELTDWWETSPEDWDQTRWC